jgi:hypothetical protein
MTVIARSTLENKPPSNQCRIAGFVVKDRAGWSADSLARCAEEAVLGINPIVYAEVSIRFARIEDLEEALPAASFERPPLPWTVTFLARVPLHDRPRLTRAPQPCPIARP